VRLKDLQTVTLLFDFYGPLLTPRQQQLIRAYYLEDLSLAEIAGEDGVSRQAVHDLIKRAEALLVEYEEKLGLLGSFRGRQEQLARLEEAVQRQNQALALAIIAALQDE
jgi:uncharacterized protein